MGNIVPMPKFRLERTVDAKIDVVYGLFADCMLYGKRAPQYFPSVRVRSVRGDTYVAEEHMILGSRELVMMVRHVTQKSTLHEMFVIGGDAKGSHIRQKFLEVPYGTLVIIHVDIKTRPSLFGHTKQNYARIIDGLLDVAKKQD